jgi:hypothetical protein
VGYTPALAKLICLEGADEPTDLKAERHLEQTGGISVSARQIQRVVQRVGSAAQSWQERPAQLGPLRGADNVCECRRHGGAHRSDSRTGAAREGVALAVGRAVRGWRYGLRGPFPEAVELGFWECRPCPRPCAGPRRRAGACRAWTAPILDGRDGVHGGRHG